MGLNGIDRIQQNSKLRSKVNYMSKEEEGARGLNMYWGKSNGSKKKKSNEKKAHTLRQSRYD